MTEINRENLTNHEFKSLKNHARVIVTSDNGKHVAVSYFLSHVRGKEILDKQIFLNKIDRGDLEFVKISYFISR